MREHLVTWGNRVERIVYLFEFDIIHSSEHEVQNEKPFLLHPWLLFPGSTFLRNKREWKCEIFLPIVQLNLRTRVSITCVFENLPIVFLLSHSFLTYISFCMIFLMLHTVPIVCKIVLVHSPIWLWNFFLTFLVIPFICFSLLHLHLSSTLFSLHLHQHLFH